MIPRPTPGEYPQYQEEYINRVHDGNILEILSADIEEYFGLLAGLEEEKALHRYAPDKWSVKEVIGHVIDCEQIFGARALCIARGETAPLPGFDQDVYMRHADFDGQSMMTLVDRWRVIREGTVHLFESLDEEALERRGTIDDNPQVVGNLAWLAAGHAQHHVHVLQEKYGI